MAVAWDTTLLGALREEGHLIDLVDRRLTAGDPISVTAPSLHEVAYGYAKAARAGHRGFVRLLAWLRGFVSQGRIEVLPFSRRAALLAGELRGRHHALPTRRRAGRGSRAEARVAWVLDIQIAATAWTAGRELSTANRGDFEVIAGLISELAPGAPPLRISAPPG